MSDKYRVSTFESDQLRCHCICNKWSIRRVLRNLESRGYDRQVDIHVERVGWQIPPDEKAEMERVFASINEYMADESNWLALPSSDPQQELFA